MKGYPLVRPFLYFDRSTSTSLLRLAYFDLCTSTFCEIWTSYWSRRTGRSTVLVEVQKRSKIWKWSKYRKGRTDAYPYKRTWTFSQKTSSGSRSRELFMIECCVINSVRSRTSVLLSGPLVRFDATRGSFIFYRLVWIMMNFLRQRHSTRHYRAEPVSRTDQLSLSYSILIFSAIRALRVFYFRVHSREQHEPMF